MKTDQSEACTNDGAGKVEEGAGRVTADKSTEYKGKVEKHEKRDEAQNERLKDAIETKETK